MHSRRKCESVAQVNERDDVASVDQRAFELVEGVGPGAIEVGPVVKLQLCRNALEIVNRAGGFDRQLEADGDRPQA